MKRSPIFAVLAMISVQACSADDPTERPAADAGRDTRTTSRADALADQNDARGADAIDVTDAGAPPSPDGAADVEVPPLDATDDRPNVDASDTPDLADSATPDVAPPLDADAGPPPFDATSDPIVTTCFVSFTVSGVAWDSDAGAPDAQSSARIVRVVGDIANLGSWTPTAGVPLAETLPGTWSGTASLRDQQLVEFKFVKLQGSTPEWESWQPYDSNRALRVECGSDGGVLSDAGDGAAPPLDAPTSDGATSDAAGDATDSDVADAISDATPSDASSGDAGADGLDATTADAADASSDARGTGPARGRNYTGVFGVRPPDATK